MMPSFVMFFMKITPTNRYLDILERLGQKVVTSIECFPGIFNVKVKKNVLELMAIINTAVQGVYTVAQGVEVDFKAIIDESIGLKKVLAEQKEICMQLAYDYSPHPKSVDSKFTAMQEEVDSYINKINKDFQSILASYGQSLQHEADSLGLNGDPKAFVIGSLKRLIESSFLSTFAVQVLAENFVDVKSKELVKISVVDLNAIWQKYERLYSVIQSVFQDVSQLPWDSNVGDFSGLVKLVQDQLKSSIHSYDSSVAEYCELLISELFGNVHNLSVLKNLGGSLLLESFTKIDLMKEISPLRRDVVELGGSTLEYVEWLDGEEKFTRDFYEKFFNGTNFELVVSAVNTEFHGGNVFRSVEDLKQLFVISDETVDVVGENDELSNYRLKVVENWHEEIVLAADELGEDYRKLRDFDRACYDLFNEFELNVERALTGQLGIVEMDSIENKFREDFETLSLDLNPFDISKLEDDLRERLSALKSRFDEISEVLVATGTQEEVEALGWFPKIDDTVEDLSMEFEGTYIEGLRQNLIIQLSKQCAEAIKRLSALPGVDLMLKNVRLGLDYLMNIKTILEQIEGQKLLLSLEGVRFDEDLQAKKKARVDVLEQVLNPLKSSLTEIDAIGQNYLPANVFAEIKDLKAIAEKRELDGLRFDELQNLDDLESEISKISSLRDDLGIQLNELKTFLTDQTS